VTWEATIGSLSRKSCDGAPGFLRECTKSLIAEQFGANIGALAGRMALTSLPARGFPIQTLVLHMFTRSRSIGCAWCHATQAARRRLGLGRSLLVGAALARPAHRTLRPSALMNGGLQTQGVSSGNGRDEATAKEVSKPLQRSSAAVQEQIVTTACV